MLDWTLILMPWGRVGSNLMLDILSQSGKVVLHNEPFTVIKTELWGRSTAEIGVAQETWLQEHLIELEDGKRLVVKLSAESIAAKAAFRDFLQRTRVRLVLMDRRNILATAVSALRAAAYAEQRKAECGVESWALLQDEEANVLPVINENGLKRAIAMILAQRRSCEEFAAALPAVTRVWYEELVSDFGNQVSRVVDAAGLAPFPYTVRHKKFTAMPLLQSIANPETLLKVAREASLETQLT